MNKMDAVYLGNKTKRDRDDKIHKLYKAEGVDTKNIICKGAIWMDLSLLSWMCSIVSEIRNRILMHLVVYISYILIEIPIYIIFFVSTPSALYNF